MHIQRRHGGEEKGAVKFCQDIGGGPGSPSSRIEPCTCEDEGNKKVRRRERLRGPESGEESIGKRNLEKEGGK